MRIIGGHDYYDSAQAYGHDPKIVFVRGIELLPQDTFHRPYAAVYFVYPDKLKNNGWYDRYGKLTVHTGQWNFEKVCVIFCGKFYTGLKCEHTPDYDLSKGGLALHQKEDTQVFWNKSEFADWCRGVTELIPVIENDRWRDTENELFTVKNVVGEEYHTLLHKRISIAIYIRNDKKWKINCIGLKDFQFYRIFPAAETFQELDMWMSGALGMPGNPIVEVSDKVRMEKHGMDKWSFRKKVR